MRNKTMAGVMLLGGALLLGPSIVAAPALAQDRSPSAVAECLCAQRALDIAGHELRAERRHYDEARRQLDGLDRRVEASRGSVNVEVRADIESYKQLVERRDAAQQAFNAEADRYAAAVGRYNAVAEHNNAACTGRLFDPREVEAVRARLACPRP